jgi:cytochrome c-type biogenesis protein CcmH/NrfG
MSAFAVFVGIGMLIFGISSIGMHPFMFLWVAVVAGITIFHLSNVLSDRGVASAVIESDARDAHEPKQSVTERLQELSRLRDEGLISEDEFERKRREIIGEL